ncbi:Tetratricopeptide repeat [Phytophthora cactorum]|nr:Tetratricopeptide repeat [Phytophthora cactorum]
MALEDAEKTLRPHSLDGDEFFATDGAQQYSALQLLVQKFQRDGLMVYLCSNNTTSGAAHGKKQNAASMAIFHRMVGHQVRAARAIHEAIEESNDDTQSNSLHAQGDEQRASSPNTTVPPFFPVSAGFTIETRDGVPTFKLQNLADLIPADVSSDNPDAIAHEVLMFKMRPEFVRMHGNNLPLHSNTHIPIEQKLSEEQRAPNKSQLEAQLLQQSAISAQECLHTIIIPEFVADLENGTVQVIDSRSLTRALHGEGINVRYLASCYELASLKHVRRALLAEMVARACKVEFRASLQTILPEATAAILRQAKAPGNIENYGSDADGEGYLKMDPATARALAKLALHEEASQVTVEFFNLVLGISSPDSKVFWEERILPQVHAKFGLSREALNLDAIISEDLLHMPQLLHALQVQTGVYFSDHMNYNFKGAEPLSLQHIQCISPRTTLLARTTTGCERMLENADAFLAARELSSALSSIMFHLSILETAPSDERNLSLCHLLTCAANISLAMNLCDQAKQLASLAIEDSPSNHAELTRAYTVLMKLKHASSDLIGAQECFAKGVEPIQWHLGPVHPLLCDTYMTMTEILGDLGEPEQAVEILQSCVALVRDCFGKTSLLYADIRRQQGMLMLAANPIDGEGIIGVLEDAFSVYEKHFQDPVEDVPVYKEFAAECCYILATLRTQVCGSQAAEAAYGIALTGLALRKEVLPPNHEEIMKSYLQLGSLSRELGEHYRAVDYFKPALSVLKTIHDDEHIDQIRSVTQTMLQLHLQTLSLEKRNIIDKTTKRFAQQWPRFASLSTKMLPEESATSGSADDVGEESALLIFVMKKLFQLEPIEYVDQLIEKTDMEFQDYRKQYNLNFAGTLRRNNADAPSPQHAMLRSSSGRFASFSGAGTFSPPGSPRAPLSLMRHPTLFPASPRGRTSFNQLDCNFLKAGTGDFTFANLIFNMAPVPAWTREWRPLARQLCAHISGGNQAHEEEQSSLSKETLLLRADRVVGQLYSHRFVDTLPQDVQAQTQALATKFRMEDGAATRATQAQAAQMMQNQLVEELFQISTNDEWYQAWEDSDDDESDWDMSSTDESAVESERSVDARIRNAKRSCEELEDEGIAIQQEQGRGESSKQIARLEMERKRIELSDEALEQDEILCRYYSEVCEREMEVDDVDPTCELDKRPVVPFTLERPWLLCGAVVKSADNSVATKDIVPSRLIHEETVVTMIFEALHGADSLLFEFHPVRPTPSIFSIDFQTKTVERSRRSLNVAIGHISPLALQHTLDYFTIAATELEMLRDVLGFIRRARDSSEQHRCVTLEGLANALSEVIRSLTDSICNVEQQTNATTGLQGGDSSPWSGINPRQPTLLGVYGGLKEIFKMISWLKGILVECFNDLSDRHWHEVKRAEQAKCVLDSLYHIMEVEYVEGATADGNARTADRLSRSDVLLHLFTGTLNPYLDLINRMVFERGHFETIPLDGELFFATPASMSVGASPVRERNRNFLEGLMSLAPFEVNRSLVPTFLESMISLMNEALASRQLKNRFLQQHTSVGPVTKLSNLGPLCTSH